MTFEVTRKTGNAYNLRPLNSTELVTKTEPKKIETEI